MSGKCHALFTTYGTNFNFVEKSGKMGDINFTDKMLRNIGFKDVRVVCKKEGNKLNADDKKRYKFNAERPTTKSHYLLINEDK
mgnify:CR=1 FL=1